MLTTVYLPIRKSLKIGLYFSQPCQQCFFASQICGGARKGERITEYCIGQESGRLGIRGCDLSRFHGQDSEYVEENLRLFLPSS